MQWEKLNCIYNCMNKSEWKILNYIQMTIKENETILIELIKISN